MAVIKIENADPHSSVPLVIDVMGAEGAEPTATHKLAFGDFVILGSLDNLHMVTVDEQLARNEAAAAEAEPKKGLADYDPVPVVEAKLKRAQLEEMTKDELMAYADDRDIEVNGHWNKADIIDAIVRG